MPLTLNARHDIIPIRKQLPVYHSEWQPHRQSDLIFGSELPWISALS